MPASSSRRSPVRSARSQRTRATYGTARGFLEDGQGPRELGGVSLGRAQRPARLGLQERQAVGGRRFHDRPDGVGRQGSAEIDAQGERALDELLAGARNRAEAPDHLGLERVQVLPGIWTQAPEERVCGKVLQDLVEYGSILVDQVAIVTGPCDVQGGDEAMDAVRGRNESALGPDLARVLGDAERVVPAPKKRQGVRPPGRGVKPPPVDLPGLKQPQRRGRRAVRLDKVTQEGRGPRHHGVRVQAFMQIEAVLERETLQGEPARLRPRPARLRAAREGVERGAPEAGIVETVGYRQAAAQCSPRPRRCPRPSSAPRARTDRIRRRSENSRWPARHWPRRGAPGRPRGAAGCSSGRAGLPTVP